MRIGADASFGEGRPAPAERAAIAALGRALVADVRDPDALAAADAFVAAGHGRLVLSALLAARGSDEAAAVKTTMPLLEAMMDAHTRLGGVAMALLLPIAMRRRLHAVADAIALWMDHVASAELADALQTLADEGARPSALKSTYARWAETIRARAR